MCMDDEMEVESELAVKKAESASVSSAYTISLSSSATFFIAGGRDVTTEVEFCWGLAGEVGCAWFGELVSSFSECVLTRFGARRAGELRTAGGASLSAMTRKPNV